MSLWKRFVALLQYEPALAAAIGQIIVAGIIARHHPLTSGQAGSIEAAVAAAGAVIVGVLTRPFRVQALAGLVTAGGTLLAAFAANFSPGTVSFWNATLAAIMLILSAQRVTPTIALRGTKQELRKSCGNWKAAASPPGGAAAFFCVARGGLPAPVDGWVGSEPPSLVPAGQVHPTARDLLTPARGPAAPVSRILAGILRTGGHHHEFHLPARGPALTW
jgi:hypothetical protein